MEDQDKNQEWKSGPDRLWDGREIREALRDAGALKARGEEGPHSPSAGHLFSVVTGNEKTENSRTSWSVFHLRFSLARPFPRLRRTALHLPTDPLTPDGGRGRRYRDVIPSLEGRLDHPFPPRLFPCLGEIEAGVELDVRPDSPGVDVVQS